MSTETEKSLIGIAREIAKRYTREGTSYADRLYQLAYAIEQALRGRDERAAQIAQAKAAQWRGYVDSLTRTDDLVGGTAKSVYLDKARLADDIASAIRGKQ